MVHERVESFSICRQKFAFSASSISAILGLHLHERCLELLHFCANLVCQGFHIVEGLIGVALLLCIAHFGAINYVSLLISTSLLERNLFNR